MYCQQFNDYFENGRFALQIVILETPTASMAGDVRNGRVMSGLFSIWYWMYALKDSMWNCISQLGKSLLRSDVRFVGAIMPATPRALTVPLRR